jgi:hypothetical protein
VTETILISALITKLTRQCVLNFKERVQPEFSIRLRCSYGLLPEAIPVSQRIVSLFQSYSCPAENQKVSVLKGATSLMLTTSAFSVGISGTMLTTSTFRLAFFFI